MVGCGGERLFLLEAVLVAALGAVAGVAIGLAGVALLGCLYPDLEMVPPAWALPAGFAMAIGTGVVFGVQPARRAPRLDPVQALSRRFNDALCLVEVNSIGQPQLEALQTMGVPVQGFQTTNATKLEIFSALQLAFEQERIKILNDPLAISELMAYQAERLPSGLLRYGAPKGMHDDTIISLCLAWWAGSTSWLISSFD